MAFRYHHRILSLLLLGPSMLAACNRYEYVNELDLPECKNRPPPILVHAGPVALEPVDSAWLYGIVVRKDDGEPLEGAQVRVLSSDSAGVLTDRLGRFAFRGAPSHGLVHLDIRRIGFAHYTDTVSVPLERGTAWRVALAVMANDGPCSGLAAVRVRKPWWKFW